MDAPDTPPPDRRRMSFLRWLADPLTLPRPGENPLADYTLGRSPKSRRRARRAVFDVALTFICFLFLVTVSGLLLHDEISTLMGWAFLFLLCRTGVTVALLISLPLQSGRLRMFRKNWHEYIMAGMHPRQILVGIAAPGLRSARVVFLVFGVIAAIEAWLLVRGVKGDFEREPYEFLLTALATFATTLDLAFWMLYGRVLTVAFWRVPPAIVAAILLLIPLTSAPLLILLGLELYFVLNIEWVWPVVILLILLRPFGVSYLWHRELRRLEIHGP